MPRAPTRRDAIAKIRDRMHRFPDFNQEVRLKAIERGVTVEFMIGKLADIVLGLTHLPS